MSFKTSSLILSHLGSELLYIHYRWSNRWRGDCSFSETCPHPPTPRRRWGWRPLHSLWWSQHHSASCLLKPLLSVVPVMVLCWPLAHSHSFSEDCGTYLQPSPLPHTIPSPSFTLTNVPSDSQALYCFDLLSAETSVFIFFWLHGYTEDI